MFLTLSKRLIFYLYYLKTNKGIDLKLKKLLKNMIIFNTNIKLFKKDGPKNGLFYQFYGEKPYLFKFGTKTPICNFLNFFVYDYQIFEDRPKKLSFLRIFLCENSHPFKFGIKTPVLIFKISPSIHIETMDT